MTETFIKERPLQDEPGVVKPVKIDDACAFLARFDNGALGTFESTRYARGRKNQNMFEVNGEKGSIYFNLEDPHRLQFFDHGDPSHLHGWRSILVTDFEHPYMNRWWVPGCTIGYEHTFINALADFLTSLDKGGKVQPDFRAGLETQFVCDAVLESARTEKWVNVPKS
jgi:predicted dehydrogenase